MANKETIFEFSEVFSSAINSSLSKIKHFISPTNFKITQKLHRDIEYAIRETVFSISKQTILAELFFACQANRLKGESPKSRYKFFIEELCKPSTYDALLNKYPGLLCAIDSSLHSYENCLQALLTKADTDFLKFSRFGIRQGVSLDKIQFLGDSHRCQEKSAMLAFGNKKIIYKTRSVATDRLFLKALSLIANELGYDYPMPTMIDGANYSWHEYLDGPWQNDTSALIKKYYFCLGNALALAYVTQLRDVHLENVIAHDGLPYFIDSECIFTPTLMHDLNRDTCPNIGTSLIVPILRYHKKSDTCFDVSAFSGYSNQKTPSYGYVIKNEGSDQAQLKLDWLYSKQVSNTPIMGQGLVNPLGFSQSFISGFSKAYDLLLKDGESFFSLFFADYHIKTRIVLRPTMVYDQLLQSRFSPAAFRRKIPLEIFFGDQLKKLSRSKNFPIKLIDCESSSLAKMNIPSFYSTPMSKTIFDARGNEIPGIVKEPGAKRCNRIISEIISTKDKERQLKIIENSLDALAFKNKVTVIKSEKFFFKSSEPEKKIKLILDHIKNISVTNNEEIFWPTIIFRNNGKREYVHNQNTHDDFYDGLLGLAFLFCFAKKKKYVRHDDFYEKIIFNACKRAIKNCSNNGGFYGGIASVIFSLTHITNQEALPQYQSAMHALIRKSIEISHNAAPHDVVGGLAGTVLGPISISKIKNGINIFDKELLLKITKLVNTVQIEAIDDHGFAHGKAGFLYVITRAKQLLKDNFNVDTKKIATLATSIEETIRKGLPKDLSWCHGLTGMLLPLQFYYRVFNQRSNISLHEYHKDIVSSALKMDSLGMCHGMSGVIEYFCRCNELNLGDKEKNQLHIKKIIKKFLSAEDNSYERGSIGLLTGVGGVAYSLLRLSTQGELPSVLYP